MCHMIEFVTLAQSFVSALLQDLDQFGMIDKLALGIIDIARVHLDRQAGRLN